MWDGSSDSAENSDVCAGVRDIDVKPDASRLDAVSSYIGSHPQAASPVIFKQEKDVRAGKKVESPKSDKWQLSSKEARNPITEVEEDAESSDALSDASSDATLPYADEVPDAQPELLTASEDDASCSDAGASESTVPYKEERGESSSPTKDTADHVKMEGEICDGASVGRHDTTVEDDTTASSQGPSDTEMPRDTDEDELFFRDYYSAQGTADDSAEERRDESDGSSVTLFVDDDRSFTLGSDDTASTTSRPETNVTEKVLHFGDAEIEELMKKKLRGDIDRNAAQQAFYEQAMPILGPLQVFLRHLQPVPQSVNSDNDPGSAGSQE